ncbi:CMP-N-acetylneuraminate-beta-1,4-galactoside alpha-2,3-sialyltransferase isoform X4 [Crocuta crocuta]
MGLLVFVRNLLLALCLFLVLGFLYYSAWKLHLLQWEDPKYDRLGFLLKLDSKLPAELATKYANFSEGACKPGYASALMTAIFPRFSKPAPMFLDDSFRKWARIREFVPPFGIKGQVLDAQYPARERVSAEAGESTGHHRPNQWHLRGAQHMATEVLAPPRASSSHRHLPTSSAMV